VARAVPTGSRRARSQREALRAGLACPDLANVRADRSASLEAWWRIHVGYASWGGENRPPRSTTQPTRDRVCRRAGTGRARYAGRARRDTGSEPPPMSVSTYKACRRWWEDRGYIAIVRPGVRADTDGDHNQRQVYVLCVPRRKRPAQPSSCRDTVIRPLSKSCLQEIEKFPARARQTPPPRPPEAKQGVLREISDGWWAHLTRPFTGWSARDIAHAIDYLPDGRQHRYWLGSVRHPAGWLRWRLSRWLAADGQPLPTPVQLRERQRQRIRAEQAHRHASPARWTVTAAETAATPRAREAFTEADTGATRTGRPYAGRPPTARRPGPGAGLIRERAAAILDQLASKKEV
jgi:hypothetical protein